MAGDCSVQRGSLVISPSGQGVGFPAGLMTVSGGPVQRSGPVETVQRFKEQDGQAVPPFENGSTNGRQLSQRNAGHRFPKFQV